MSKEFKRCPRCNNKIPSQLRRCGACGLNYDKFNSATNAEAKSAFRMGEKSRVLYSKSVPSDISKGKMFAMSILGGWFGLHYFSIGRIWRGLIQILGTIFAFVYSYAAVIHGIRSGYIGYLLFICGAIWVFSFITWLSDSFAILFNKFKYPVSLPYKSAESKQSPSNVQNNEIAQDSNSKDTDKNTVHTMVDESENDLAQNNTHTNSEGNENSNNTDDNIASDDKGE